MFIEERHAAIMELLNASGRIAIGDIQEKFGVSADSARRDLRILEEKGLVKRTYGGAVLPPQIGGNLSASYIDMREVNIYPHVDAIAQKAVELIKPGDAVYITSGTVGYAMLSHLPDFEFTVVTNSVDSAAALKKYPNIGTYITGGKLRPNGRTVDAFAKEFIEKMRFDRCFLTGAGFSPDVGTTNGTPETVAFQQAVAKNSRSCVALFPSEKLGVNSFLRDVPLERFDTLITDSDASEDILAAFEESGLKVIVVGRSE